MTSDGKAHLRCARTATELRALRNYAGHRLAPWLGHVMVIRQETARPLLTPGEVMQLPPGEEIVLVSGLAPVRAQKLRHYEDANFTRGCFRRHGRLAASILIAHQRDPMIGRISESRSFSDRQRFRSTTSSRTPGRGWA